MTTNPTLETIFQRRSVRAFKSDEIDRQHIETICQAARQAPSGANLQPGRFHVLSGAALGNLIEALENAMRDGVPNANEYSYFPDPFPPELKAKQREAGYALYSALGIGRRDIAERKEQFDRNYRFFDAPVGVVVTIERTMGKGCFMDLGMALMAFFLAAESLGYGTTGIGALANYGPTVHAHLGLPERELVVCGIALGVVDTDHPANQFRTDRDDLAEFTTFSGFNPSPEE